MFSSMTNRDLKNISYPLNVSFWLNYFSINKANQFLDAKPLSSVTLFVTRDGQDIWFSIRYLARSGHFQLSGIQPDTGYQKPDIRFPNIRPDIRQTGY